MEPVAVTLGLLLAIALLATLARKLGIAYPILMVLGGLGLGLVVDALGVVEVELEPDLVFLAFLPPVLFAAAFLTSIRDFKANLRPIGLLAVGLVIFTTVSVAVVAHALIPGIGWAGAFVLGAIVAPPDAIATTAIMGRLGVPRRVVTVLEGESLVNDATALVLWRVAVAAVGSGTFSLLDASVGFVTVAAGGILIGLAVAALAVPLFRQLHDPPVEVTLSLLLPYAAFLPAEMVGVSGVLATVTAGLVFGRAAPRIMASDTRVLAGGVWQMALFVINGLVFTLIGLQLPTILDALAGHPRLELIGLGLAISLTVIVVRILWVYPATYLPRWLSAKLRARDPAPPPRVAFVVAWAGLRGIVSLAAALALPRLTPDGAFPQRDLIIFLAFFVILVTLVGQGLSLPFVIRRLGISADRVGEREERTARSVAAEAALRRLDALEDEWPDHRPLVDQLRTMYAHRAEHLPTGDGPTEELDQELVEHTRIRRAVIDAERQAIIDLRDRGVISDEVLRLLERDLDLEELRMEA
jgi:Na+/H+ antiporter